MGRDLSCLLDSGHHKLPIFEFAKRLVTRTNCVVFFGNSLANEPEFVKAALQFPEDVFLAAEILRILPTAISSFVASFSRWPDRLMKIDSLQVL